MLVKSAFAIVLAAIVVKSAEARPCMQGELDFIIPVMEVECKGVIHTQHRQDDSHINKIKELEELVSVARHYALIHSIMGNKELFERTSKDAERHTQELKKMSSIGAKVIPTVHVSNERCARLAQYHAGNTDAITCK